MMEERPRNPACCPDIFQARHNCIAEILVRDTDRGQPGRDPLVQRVVIETDDPEGCRRPDPVLTQCPRGAVRNEITQAEDDVGSTSVFDRPVRCEFERLSSRQREFP